MHMERYTHLHKPLREVGEELDKSADAGELTDELTAVSYKNRSKYQHSHGLISRKQAQNIVTENTPNK